MKNKIAFIIPFFGDWPFFTKLFLQGCEGNRRADFLLISEKPPCENLPKNALYIKMSADQLRKRFEDSTKMKHSTVPGHKLCDFRPFFGLAFADILKDYGFWGYCDIDMMFGNIDKILDEPFLDELDVFSAHHAQFVGHCTFFRNCAALNHLGFEIPNLEFLLTRESTSAIDEERFSQVLKKYPEIRWARPDALDKELKKPFCRHAITFSFGGVLSGSSNIHNPVVLWKDGQLEMMWEQNQRTEILYVHFMGTKHPWHWPTGLQLQKGSKIHIFSKLGYGRVQSPSEIKRLRFKSLYLWQCCLLRIKNISGVVLKKVFSPKQIRKIRKAIRI